VPLRGGSGGADNARVDWKKTIGWMLVAFGVLGFFQLLAGASSGTNSYGIGQITGAILFPLGGVWLIRSGKPRVRT
jgi:hypothetical protein